MVAEKSSLCSERESRSVGVSLRSLVVFILTTMCRPALSQTCTFIGACACRYENGSVVDLSPVGLRTGSARFQKIKQNSTDRYSYYYNPCYSFKLGTEVCSFGVAVCQVSEDKQYQNCGDQDSGGFIWNSSIQALYLTYHHSERTTNIRLQCMNNGTDDKLVVLGETTLRHYDMILFSRCACPDACQSDESHLSTGSILIIIFLVFLIPYLCLGIVYNHLVRGAHGLELIPNYEFWRDFPLLVRDGCVYVASGCKSETSYERI